MTALRVAVIGAGPAAVYAADTLLKSDADVAVDLFEKLPAPFGLVRSRALADPRRRLRLALTVSVLRRGDWSPAVADPQYVALACDDVLATAAAARAAGVPLLAVPANYHDDLAARLDLPADTVAAYRELGVLHDRDAHGDYLQACTELLASL